MQLVNLWSEDKVLLEWVKRKTDKYTSPKMQNEMAKVMALHIPLNLSSNIQSSAFYTIMLDETTGVANIKQVVVCHRWACEKCEVHGESVGLYLVIESVGSLQMCC